MKETAKVNRRFVIAKYPKGDPAADVFRLETTPAPQPRKGQILLRTFWLSLDPYMRVRLYEVDSYMPSVKLGEVMVGGTVSRVEVSNHPDYKIGDLVHFYAGWQDDVLSDGSDIVVKLPADVKKPSWYLGALGMPGFAAWYSLMKIGKPKVGETFVIAAATGAVGQIAGQLAKAQGCRVVGIAGGAKKCAFATGNLGFDACVDHYAKDFPAQLAVACPKGVDIYIENVGGAVFDAVRPLFNSGARIPICGLIAHYSGGGLDGKDRLPEIMSEALFKRLRIEGFIIFDHYSKFYSSFVKDAMPLIESGKLKIRENVVDGLRHAPKAVAKLFNGTNTGKLLVRVSDEPKHS